MVQLQLNRETGQGTLVGLNQKIDEIAALIVRERIPDNLEQKIGTIENFFIDEMAIQNAIGNALRSGIQFILGSDATGDLYYRSNSGPLARLGIGTNGQALVVSSGLPAWANLVLLNWSVVAGTTQAAQINSGYIANASALCTIILPATAPVGSLLEIVGMGAGGWRLAQGAGQQVVFGSISNTSGTGGQLNSTHQRDAIRLVNIVADTTWQVISSVGNIDVI